MTVGLIIYVNKYNACFETIEKIFECTDLDSAKNQLINYLVDQFKNLNIDYPFELVDFEYLWFGQQFVRCNSFYYKLCIDSKLSEPWELQDIYTDILDEMLRLEHENPPDFSKLYCEPTIDDTDENSKDVFNSENNEQISELETKLKEIIAQAKTANHVEETVKQCNCEKCINQCKLKEEEIGIVEPV